ncbi:thiamine monophosphate synthase/TENI family protein [Asticcacaulis biprosthecium C19]|uniref:Thiamine monophosphate synthase/TENI family protein n=1 Tax=Asticcacaulis biprosthecium C19 TaxID=715226 RepID=F4QK01_9CAUL|nr:thiamine phosphate synthase [Asticcacaulis biprosthecium]EGF92028.1 thiamine monophosphate synthase/TENI family protein [Asticcacaulis biprosthecium C19]
MTYRTRFQYLFDKATDITQEARAFLPSDRRLPPLFFVTDPARTPHPEDIAALMPAGTGIIYRHFGDSHALQRARLLRRIADDHGLVLLIGEDDALAIEVGADGVHLAQKSLPRVAHLHRDHPELKLSIACHDLDTLMHLADDAPLQAVFVSPVFASRSTSAQNVAALGAKGVHDYTAATGLPVYGLGGITCDTIGELRDCGLAGIGAVDAFHIAD